MRCTSVLLRQLILLVFTKYLIFMRQHQMSFLYRGFSLHEFRSKQTTKLVDLDLIKMNLLTHIYTSKGERLMMTNFGTRIPDLVFEPLTKEALDIIREDLTMVCNYDPRIQLLDLTLEPVWDEGAVLVTMSIKYIEKNTTDTLALTLQFED